MVIQIHQLFYPLSYINIDNNNDNDSYQALWSKNDSLHMYIYTSNTTTCQSLDNLHAFQNSHLNLIYNQSISLTSLKEIKSINLSKHHCAHIYVINTSKYNHVINFNKSYN